MQNRITPLLMTTAIVVIFLALFSAGPGVRGEETAILPYCLEVNGIAPDVYREADGAVPIGVLATGARIYPTAKSGDRYAFALADGSNAYIEAKGVEAGSGVAFIAAAEAALYRADDGAPLKTLAVGDAVTLTGRRGDQYQATLDGGAQGFVNKSDLNAAAESGAVLAAEEIFETAAYTEKRAKTASNVNVRTGPGTAYTVMASLPNGTAVTIIDESNGWYQVRLADSRTGYIRCDLLQISEGEQTPIEGDLKGTTIVVDPGHGAHDPGAQNKSLNVNEKDLNLSIGLLLRDELVAKGAKVIMTRETDIFWELKDRVAIANQIPSDYFISIHCNSVENSSIASGAETWYATHGDDTSLNAERKAMATAIQAQLAHDFGSKRGIKSEKQLYVTRNTTMPAILVECGFLSNNEETKKLIQADYQKRIAQSICQGFLDYVANSYKGFADVRTHWARESIEFVVGAELFNGTTAQKFDPNLTMTRGMLVTVLHRMAGEPAAQGDAAFTDLAANAYYVKAVAWANEQGIVTGVGGGRFAPDANITRQELVTMFNRYAAANQQTLPQKLTDSFQKYSDCGQVQAWAAAAMEWAYQGGLVNGRTATTLVPCGTATRAEVAVICQRFLDGVAP